LLICAKLFNHFHTVIFFMHVLEVLLDADNGRAVFEIYVRILLEREPWVIRNHPSVVYFKIRLASFKEIGDTCISSSIRGISVVIEYSFLAQCFRENFGTFVSIHVRRIFVECSTRSVYHVGHDYFVQSWIGSFIRDFSAYGGGYFFN
jgi:hypothetical protein